MAKSFIRVRCPFCVVPGMEVFGENGYYSIENSQEGQLVKGMVDSQPILKVIKRYYSGEVVTIKARHLEPITVTPDHPIMVRSLVKSPKPNLRIIGGEPSWKNAIDLKPTKDKMLMGDMADCVIIPKNKKAIIPILNFMSFAGRRAYRVPMQIKGNVPLTPHLAELMGWYAAEGHPTPKGLVFSLNEKEIKNIIRIQVLALSLGYSSVLKYHKTDHAVQIEVCSRILPRAFSEWIGHGAMNKHVPGFLYDAPVNLIKPFILAFAKGDGCKDKKRLGYNSMSSSSKQLLKGLQLIAMKAGIFLGYGSCKRKDTNHMIDGRIIKSDNPRYQLRGYLSDCKIVQRQWHEDDDFIYLPIEKITRKNYSGDVYNLTTAENIYLMPYVVHNCGSMPYPGQIDETDKNRPPEVHIILMTISGKVPSAPGEVSKGKGKGGHGNITYEDVTDQHPDLVAKYNQWFAERAIKFGKASGILKK